jgi:DNA-binding transcriptional regulator YiaG
MNGAEIKSLRESVGLTQEDLAEIVGVSQPTLVDWEQGNKRPSQRRAERLRVVLCDVEDLFIP